MARKILIASTLAAAVALFAFLASFALPPEVPAVAAAIPSAQQDRLIRPYSPILGREDAPVTIVEFFDPACEACRAFYPVVEEILADNPDDVRVVLRYTPFHGEASELAIKLLEAARMQDVFVPVLEPLWKSSHNGRRMVPLPQISSWRSPGRLASTSAQQPNRSNRPTWSES